MLARFFIDRPVFAIVISLVIVFAGITAYLTLPIAQYPEITPPTVEVSCSYPGASAKVVQETIAAPIEQEVNGVEKMLYMSSQSTNDGGYKLSVTFKLGTNLDMAQVLVQNRVALALPKLPDVVKTTGVSTKKKSPSILLVVNLYSDVDESTGLPKFNQLFLSNYATIQMRDDLLRLDGVGDVTYLGQQDYSMRAWLDPEKMASRNLTAGDVVNALKEQKAFVWWLAWKVKRKEDGSRADHNARHFLKTGAFMAGMKRNDAKAIALKQINRRKSAISFLKAFFGEMIRVSGGNSSGKSFEGLTPTITKATEQKKELTVSVSYDYKKQKTEQVKQAEEILEKALQAGVNATTEDMREYTEREIAKHARAFSG